MKLFRLPFKIIAAPIVLVLTPVIALLRFLFCYAELLLNIASVILVGLAIISFFSSHTRSINGLFILILAFLISPFGLPRIADWLIEKLADLNDALKNFIKN